MEIQYRTKDSHVKTTWIKAVQYHAKDSYINTIQKEKEKNNPVPNPRQSHQYYLETAFQYQTQDSHINQYHIEKAV